MGSGALFGFFFMMLLIISTLAATNITSSRPGLRKQHVINMDIFHADFELTLNHFTLDADTGYVYVCGKNRLYFLSNTLTLRQKASTGPELDSRYCPPTGNCPCDTEKCQKRLMDNTCKALLTEPKSGTLVYCSSLFQGRCQERRLRDLLPIGRSANFITSNDDVSKVVMFLAKGPVYNDDVLYVAVTRSTVGLSILKNIVPAISSRKISDFSLAVTTLAYSTSLNYNTELQEELYKRIEYKYGFSHGGYSYFLMVQRSSPTDPSPFVTRVGRICQTDPAYRSYVEFPLECTYRRVSYSLLQAAEIAPVGENLARSMNIPTKDMVLFAVFAKANTMSNEPENDSVMCVYAISQLDLMFHKIITDCFNGIGHTGPRHFTSAFYCQTSVSNVGLYILHKMWDDGYLWDIVVYIEIFSG